MNKKVKENAKERRARLAKELEAAYNGGGDYAKVIKEIESFGDTIKGWIKIKAEGLVTEDSCWMTYGSSVGHFFRRLPSHPANGWGAEIYFTEVIYDGNNTPPPKPAEGHTAFRKDIWR